MSVFEILVNAIFLYIFAFLSMLETSSIDNIVAMKVAVSNAM